MPTKKIRDLHPHDTCTHPEHEPPRYMVYQPGVYEHTCPACGRKIEFTVRGTMWTHRPGPGDPTTRWQTAGEPRYAGAASHEMPLGINRALEL